VTMSTPRGVCDRQHHWSGARPVRRHCTAALLAGLLSAGAALPAAAETADATGHAGSIDLDLTLLGLGGGSDSTLLGPLAVSQGSGSDSFGPITGSTVGL